MCCGIYTRSTICSIHTTLVTSTAGWPFVRSRADCATALQNAVNDVQLMISGLTTHIDLVKKPSTTLFDILSALTMGLVFLFVCKHFQIATLQNS